MPDVRDLGRQSVGQGRCRIREWCGHTCRTRIPRLCTIPCWKDTSLPNSGSCLQLRILCFVCSFVFALCVCVCVCVCIGNFLHSVRENLHKMAGQLLSPLPSLSRFLPHPLWSDFAEAVQQQQRQASSISQSMYVCMMDKWPGLLLTLGLGTFGSILA